MSSPMPVLFVGHGSPLNATEKNDWTRTWEKLATRIPHPKAILCISAHWMREGTAVTAMKKPRTIHDFYGFPESLTATTYPAPGSPTLAKNIQKIVHPTQVALDHEWGLDHGAWSVLLHMYPAADIPVVQLSLDYHISATDTVRIGTQLGTLRDEGVLILGSGNIVHNLSLMRFNARAYPWARTFDETIQSHVRSQNMTSLTAYTQIPDAVRAQPTADHFLPLLYCLGAAGKETPEFFNTDIVMGSVSMTGIAWGVK